MLERSNKQPLRVVAEPEKRPARCLHCESSQLHSKGRYRRQVKHLRNFGNRVSHTILFRCFQCLACGHPFVQPLPGIRFGRHSSENPSENKSINSTRMASVDRHWLPTFKLAWQPWNAFTPSSPLARPTNVGDINALWSSVSMNTPSTRDAVLRRPFVTCATVVCSRSPKVRAYRSWSRF